MSEKTTSTNTPQNPTTNEMWGGRFTKGPAELMEKINVSLGFDRKMFQEDIAASKVHARMLSKVGLISKDECAKILEGFDQVKSEIEDGTFPFRNHLEDIHMNVEARLKEIVGEAAGRVHTARSRNDQVATDFRLWVRGAIDHMDELFISYQKALLDRAEEHAETLMPGFTHLQTAQPVTFGHHLMAYYEMARRDRSRLADCRKRMNECPLGSAALAGTAFPIDRDMTANELGFDGPTRNSLDAVSDRDFAIELLSALSIAAMHLSRFAEEFVVWSSAPFGFARMSDDFSSGSSIMPQKRNPDAAELVRAKPGRIYGALMGMLTMMKGLPLAYSKDMQEDKEPVFEAVDTFEVCLGAMTEMVKGVTVNKDNMKEQAGAGFSTATDLADWLVRELNTPFREAHHIVGAIVKMAEDKGVGLDGLSLADMQTVEAKISEGVLPFLNPETSVKSRTSFGGTAPDNVRAAIQAAKGELET